MSSLIIPESLLCEYAINPLGIDTKHPRFSWTVEKIQIAYQILVSSSKALLEKGCGDLWDTKKVDGSQSLNVEYCGKSLCSAQRCYWQVKIWDMDGGESQFSDIAWFETALLSQEEWEAKWISAPMFGVTSPLFRKEFKLEKSISSARAYISGLGYYELSINGEKVGDHVLDTAWTDYSKRVLYSTYDVSEMLVVGANAIGVMLGCGWYNSSHFNTPHNALKFIMKIDISFEDGTVMRVVTDNNSGWIVTGSSPIVCNSIYDGETYDARLEVPEWNTPNYNTNGKGDLGKSDIIWKSPVVVSGPGGRMVAQTMEPIKVVMEMKPITLKSPRNGIYVYDLGQNISGWARLKVIGERGTEVRLRFSELLYEDGTVNTENLRKAKATDTYILKGGSEEVYEPRFTYHGFRYVQVEGYPGTPDSASITGRVIRSAVESTGYFICDNDLINQIHKAVVWTEADNLQGILTDCPQRDERLGWLNDATVRTEELVYNFNVDRLLNKWERDIKDTQEAETGAIADTAPFFRFGRKPADPVCSSYLIVPWFVYLHYGDKRILEEHYEGMKKWNEYLGIQSTDYIVNYSSYGDWASPINQAIEGSCGAGAISATTPGELMSSGYYYYNTVLLGKIAGIIGREDDQGKFFKLSERIKDAFNKKFFNMEKRQYALGSQASNIFPLFLGLVPKEYRRDVLQNVVHNVIEINKLHLTTGNLCTKYIMDILAEEGFIDVAFDLVTQTTYPSWGYMIENGATTIWERWELVTTGEMCEMASHNHPMYASIGAWFYKILAGINVDEAGPGYEKIIIKPHIPTRLNYVAASVKTVRGTVVSSWKKENGSILLDVIIPANSSAKVYVPKVETKSDNVVITENGTVIWSCRLKSKEQAGKIIDLGDYVMIEVGSGSFSFKYE